MKRRVVQAIAAFLCCMAMLSNSTVCSMASDNVQDVTVNKGGSSDLVSHGSTENSSNSAKDSYTNSSSSSAPQATSAELNAHEAQQAVRGELSKLWDKAAQDSIDHVYGIHSGGKNLAGIGFVKVGEDTIERILNNVNTYQGYLGQDNVDAYYDNQSQENGMLPHKKLAEDDSTKVVEGSSGSKGNAGKGSGKSDKDEKGSDKSKNPSTSASVTVDRGPLTKEELEKIKNAIAKKEGFPLSNSAASRFNLTGSNGKQYAVGYTGAEPMFYFDDAFVSPGNPQWTGIREDLIQGGLNDFYNWNSRFSKLDRFISNSMEDYCNLAYMINYHISKVNKNYLTDIEYNDVRYWSIYKTDDKDATEPTGEPVKTVKLNNAKHKYRFEGFEPGIYLVIPEQEAEYTVNIYADYDIADYLFDTETKTLLYFNEKLVSNGMGGSVLVKGEREKGRLKTGDIFRITVNDLGEVITDGSATERVE